MQGSLNFCIFGVKSASYSEGITRLCEKFKGPMYKKIKYSINIKQLDLAQVIIYSETITRQRICQNDAVFIRIAIFIVFILGTRFLYFLINNYKQKIIIIIIKLLSKILNTKL
jgi:hypothetical protein